MLDGGLLCIIAVPSMAIIMWIFLQARFQKRYYRKKKSNAEKYEYFNK